MIEAKAWIRCLHSSAKEFRAYREHSTEKSKKQALNLELELSEMVRSICSRGFLRSVSGLTDLVVKAEADEFGVISAFVFRRLVGYHEVQYDWDEVVAPFDSSDTHDTASPFLGPGLLGRDYPYVFKNIDGGLLVDAQIKEYIESDAPQKFIEDSRYERLGYFATACELLADIIEEEVKLSRTPSSSESTIEPITSEGESDSRIDVSGLKSTMRSPIDEAIALALQKYSDCWQAIDYDELPALERDSIESLCSAGLIEIECEVRASMQGSTQSFLGIVRIEGSDPEGEVMKNAVGPSLPAEWWDEKGGLKSKAEFREKPIRVRLTSQGTEAKHDLFHHRIEHVFSYVRAPFVRGKGPGCIVDLKSYQHLPTTAIHEQWKPSEANNAHRKSVSGTNDMSVPADDLVGPCMTDDEMLSAAEEYFDSFEKLSRTRELESKLKHVLKLIKASTEWKEVRIRKGPEAPEVVERQTEILDQWNKLRRETSPLVKAACDDAAKHGVDDLAFFSVQRLIREGRLDSRLSDSVEAALDELERLEARNLSKVELTAIDETSADLANRPNESGPEQSGGPSERTLAEAIADPSNSQHSARDLRGDEMRFEYIRSALGQRDQFVYEKRNCGMRNPQVIAELEKIFSVKGWELLTTPQGIRDAVKRWCINTGASPISNVVGGRPKSRNHQVKNAK